MTGRTESLWRAFCQEHPEQTGSLERLLSGVADGTWEEQSLQLLHQVAVQGAGTQQLDVLAALLEAFSDGLWRQGLLDRPVRLPRFAEPDVERERFVRQEWAMSDWFYGIGPKPGEGE